MKKPNDECTVCKGTKYTKLKIDVYREDVEEEAFECENCKCIYTEEYYLPKLSKLVGDTSENIKGWKL